MGTPAPPLAVRSGQTQPGLVNERGGLKGLTRFLMGHAGGSQPAQFFIDQRQQLFGGNRVALFRTFQNARHFAHIRTIRVQT